MTPGGPMPGSPVPGDPVPGGPVPDDPVPDGPVPGGPVPGGPVPGGPVPGGPVPGGPVPDGPVPGGPVPGGPVPGGPVPGGPVPGGPVPGDPVPGGPVPDGPIPGELAQRARAWIADDPSARDRAELQDLLEAAGRDDAAGRAAAAGLADRFAGRLQFGTAGLRGAIGAGPNRMNRAVVRAATAGLARWLREHRPDAARAGVVLGWDARHRSAEFAAEAAGVLSGAGIRVHLLPGRSPTPLLAFAVRHLSAGPA